MVSAPGLNSVLSRRVALRVGSNHLVCIVQLGGYNKDGREALPTEESMVMNHGASILGTASSAFNFGSSSTPAECSAVGEDHEPMTLTSSLHEVVPVSPADGPAHHADGSSSFNSLEGVPFEYVESGAPKNRRKALLTMK